MNSILFYLFAGVVVCIGVMFLLDYTSYQKVRFSDYHPVTQPKFSLRAFVREFLATLVIKTSIDTTPSLKRILTFAVPYRFRIDESVEAKVTYYEAITVRLLDATSSFIYERVISFIKPDNDGLRGRIVFPVPGRLSRDSHLASDIGVRLSSSKMLVAPTEWVFRKSGEKIPCEWRWSLSCNELGKYHLVFEADDDFRRLVGNDQLGKPILFEVEVRSPYGLTLRQVDFLKSVFKTLGIVIGALFTLAMTLLAFPAIQTRITSFFP